MKKRSYQKKLAIVLTILLIVGLTSSGVFADNEPQNQNAPPGSSVSDFSGSGTTDDPYRIRTAVDLTVLSKEVNDGKSFQDVSFLITDDLDFKEIQWIPIGTLDDPFQGDFNGNQRVILNLNYAGEEMCAGLFGCIVEAVVKNIVIDNNCTFKNANHSGKLGAVVGYAQQSKVKNCVNNAYVTGLSDDGGNTEGVGGVVGVSSATKIDCCVNRGMVTGLIGVGGIVGNGQAVNCINDGRVSGASTSSYLGGIAGKSMGTAAYNCVNNGPVSGGTWIGGIVGGAYEESVSLTIDECINRGSVTSLKLPGMGTLHIGGILGQAGIYINDYGSDAEQYFASITDCANYGKIDHLTENNKSGITSEDPGIPPVINNRNSGSENINLRSKVSTVDQGVISDRNTIKIKNTYGCSDRYSFPKNEKDKFTKSYAFTKPS